MSSSLTSGWALKCSWNQNQGSEFSCLWGDSGTKPPPRGWPGPRSLMVVVSCSGLVQRVLKFPGGRTVNSFVLTSRGAAASRKLSVMHLRPEDRQRPVGFPHPCCVLEVRVCDIHPRNLEHCQLLCSGPPNVSSHRLMTKVRLGKSKRH